MTVKWKQYVSKTFVKDLHEKFKVVYINSPTNYFTYHHFCIFYKDDYRGTNPLGEAKVWSKVNGSDWAIERTITWRCEDYFISMILEKMHETLRDK